MPSPSSGEPGSPDFSIIVGSVLIVKRVGSSRVVSWLQRNGAEAGACGLGRTEKGEAISLPRPFCR